ncbi:MAG: serine hydrolase, partial [Pseudomonadota bacterium]|nr:serine hydrolase [Pseudomonadota bacterium]
MMVRALALLTVTLAFAVAAPTGWAAPKYAAVVINADNSRVLHARSAGQRRYPASLTKIMTLYMIFEDLRAGKITLKTRLKVSARASRQPPSKLGLRRGDTITVKQAILALVTKSANDVATTVAENLSGSEAAFARRMT